MRILSLEKLVRKAPRVVKEMQDGSANESAENAYFSEIEASPVCSRTNRSVRGSNTSPVFASANASPFQSSLKLVDLHKHFGC